MFLILVKPLVLAVCEKTSQTKERIWVRIGTSELLIIFVVALLVLGPDKVPQYARKAGQLLGSLKGYANKLTEDINESVVEPLEDMKKPLKDVVDPLNKTSRDLNKTVNEIGKPKKKAKDEEKPAEDVKENVAKEEKPSTESVVEGPETQEKA